MRHTTYAAPVRHDPPLGAGFVVLASLLALTACAAPNAVDAFSTFDADVRGAVSARISGTASATNGEIWTRQLVTQLTAPSGQRLSAIALQGSDGEHGIAFSRSATTLTTGTYPIRGFVPNVPRPTNAWSGAYTRRTAGRLQAFFADSGELTLSVEGNRVRGAFAIYASTYTVLALPPAGTSSGGVLEVLENGSAPVTITGEFDAPNRQR